MPAELVRMSSRDAVGTGCVAEDVAQLAPFTLEGGPGELFPSTGACCVLVGNKQSGQENSHNTRRNSYQKIIISLSPK